MYDFLVREGLASATALAEIERAPDPDAEIARLGARDLDRACAAAVAFFVDMLGASLGNLALAWLPVGGIYLCGALVQKLKPVLAQGALADAFLDQPELGDLLARVPLALVDEPDLALLGTKRAALRLL
jgi:glucokinase